MKANKIFAAALAAMAIVGFNSCDKKGEPQGELTLNPVNVTIAVGETAEITATVDATWATSDAAVVAIKAEGKKCTVEGKAAGNAVVTATANGVSKTCVVLVSNGGGGGGTTTLKGSKIWPIVLDKDATEANSDKIVYNFGPDDVYRVLNMWHVEGTDPADPNNHTFKGGNGDGLNALGNMGYVALVTTGKSWAGAGWQIKNEGAADAAALAALRDEILSNPDQYALHLALKGTDGVSHCFYLFGTDKTKFSIGFKKCYDAPILIGNYLRDGDWYHFDVEMAQFAAGLTADKAKVAPGVNFFVALTEDLGGGTLNIDAVYFYKK